MIDPVCMGDPGGKRSSDMAAAACFRLREDNRWMVKSQPGVRVETSECVEAQGDLASHPLSEGQRMDCDSGIELEGESAEVW